MGNQFSTSPFLFAFRFFSGLRSLKDGIWDPRGVPAIYKLLEYAGRHGKKSIVLLFCKGRKDSEGVARMTRRTVDTLPGITFVIVPFYAVTGINRVDILFTNLMHTLITVRLVQKYNPCLLYCDRGHIGIGALLAWLTRCKVVVRMLGVARLGALYENPMNAVVHPIQYFAIRAPFSCVICSKDGSPASHVLSAFLNKKVPHVIWLNGVDAVPTACHERSFHAPARLLFVGRFEPDKGSIEFVEALRMVRERRPSSRFLATIVGSGGLEDELRTRIARYGLSRYVTFAGRASHHDTRHFYEHADVYASLNALGNLSNTVLEALAAGVCTIVLKSDRMFDTDTDELLPEEAVLRVDRTHTIEDLAAKLIVLIENPERIQEYARKVRIVGKNILKSWEERITQEWELLENICQNKIGRT